MCLIAYHASHEQFAPAELLRFAVLAEKAGFQAVHSSDHLQPWNHDQGESGHVFTWLGAAMQACALPFGLICAPGPRHHPIIIAQALATLGSLFPDRLWVSLGSGEAINEQAMGDRWPDKALRNERLEEAFHLIRRLFQGEEVTHRGHFAAQRVRLYSLPKTLPPLFGAALTAETARWLGGWAEGLITISHPLPKLKKIIKAFREGGGEGKPVYLKVQLSYARDADVALHEAHQQWRTNLFESTVLTELWRIDQFEAIGDFVDADDVARSIHISNELSQHVDWLSGYLQLGIDGLILHNVNRQQEDFIHDFGRSVLPELRAF